ncbi:MAG: MotA/TolQ/ExbB proton channel family protein [Xanthomonadaceae bacterium]|nr:MotA/TolQ/ExbB proton channel family protein [Xanthomonadaceae bacterium]MDP2184888.1 MotA/TolQ/ExbB proton channel family protein [Xanthomonadales bacterium]MDZ4115640.1 MotA/TolQ/ExbB proton channel family protein [Xanthomonadaceae bacterium]MDZ4377354.1 MotA/TolQ/ExbB proton channel family protein [Xanthomonadaceae bacterium]
MSTLRNIIVLTALSLALPALAQTPPATPATAPAPTPAAAPPTVSLEQAYKKEYAFLQAQKRELSERVAQTHNALERDRGALQGQINALESRVLAAKSQAETLSNELVRGDEQAQVAEDNRELVNVTIEQARATLGGFGDETLKQAGFADLDESEQLKRVFELATRTLGEFSRLRQEPGTFYRADGKQVDGTIIHWGNIAAYGVSAEASGALVPAGGGQLRLWDAPGQSGSESALALSKNTNPSPLGVYLFENINTAVTEPEAKTIAGEIGKGGFIGYIILALGALGLILVALRAVFLKNAGAAIAPTIDAVLRPLAEQRIDDAIAAAKRHKGSAARVVTAALRNLDRDREHLEDIISESILHESVHLNRFGAFIMVIAAVAPLLGLLGTVTGMIQTFDIITEFGTSDPKLLSGGIATALVTTELGLIVAIPMLLLGNLMGGWAERIKDDMEQAALRVVNAQQEAQFSALGKAA